MLFDVLCCQNKFNILLAELKISTRLLHILNMCRLKFKKLYHD